MSKTNETTDKSPIDRAISIIGIDVLAARYEITPQAIYKWAKKNRTPATRCVDIEGLCKRKVTRYELRPDVFGKK